MQRKRALAKQFLFLAASRLLDKGIYFAGLSWIARRLGTEQFGLVTLAFTIVIFASSLTNFGLRPVGMREMARGQSAPDVYVGRILALRLLLAVLVAPLVFVGLLFFSDMDSLVTLVAICLPTLFVNFTTLDWVFLGLGDAGPPAVAGLIRSAVATVCWYLLVRSSADSLRATILYTFAHALAFTYQAVLLLRRIGTPKMRWQGRSWLREMRQAWPIGITILLNRGELQLPVLIAGWWQLLEVVGLYRAATLVPSLLLYVTTSLVDTVLPVAAQLHGRSGSDASHQLMRVLGTVLVVGYPLTLTVAAVAPKLLELAAGEEYLVATSSMQALLWANFAGVVAAVVSTHLLAAGEMLGYSGSMAGRVVLLVGLSVPLIRWYGVAGAAWGGLLSSVANAVVVLVIYRVRVDHLPLDRRIGGAVFSLALSAMAAWGARFLSVGWFAPSLLVYIVFLLLSGALKLKDARSVLRKTRSAFARREDS